jgi:hypothetical protein
MAFKISDKTNKTTPADTDIVLIEDTGGSYFRLLWSNIKATLKTYFDTIYPLRASSPTENNIKTFNASGNDKDSGVAITEISNKLDKSSPTSGILQNMLDNSYFLIDQYVKSGTTFSSLDYLIDRILGAFSSLDNNPTFNKILPGNGQPVVGAASIKVTIGTQAVANGTVIMVQRNINKIEYFRGQTVHASVWVKSNNSNANFTLTDGVTITSSNTHTGGGDWELLSLTKAMSSSISNISMDMGIQSGGAQANYVEICAPQHCLGTERLAENPRIYSDEWKECRRYYKNEDYTNTDGSIQLVLNDVGINDYYGNIQYENEMVSIPTATIISAGTVHKQGTSFDPVASVNTISADKKSVYVDLTPTTDNKAQFHGVNWRQFRFTLDAN